jgi:ribonuclease HII
MKNLAMLVAGVDEAGRGPLAGPVVAAAVILPVQYDLPGLGDSKILSARKRAELEPLIKGVAVAWSVAEASREEIDELNILHATMLAMRRAVIALSPSPQTVKVDGNRAPKLSQTVECIIKGDSSVPCISAASILAKQARDEMMIELDSCYPQYGFAQHKAYPTLAHRKAIIKYGVCPAHRRSFKPVKERLAS